MVGFPALAHELCSCYNNLSYKTQMETAPTWSVFTASDLGLAVIGLAGLVSVVVVLRAAFGNIDTLERNRKSTSNK